MLFSPVKNNIEEQVQFPELGEWTLGILRLNPLLGPSSQKFAMINRKSHWASLNICNEKKRSFSTYYQVTSFVKLFVLLELESDSVIR